jgi:hypothetical protein
MKRDHYKRTLRRVSSGYPGSKRYRARTTKSSHGCAPWLSSNMNKMIDCLLLWLFQDKYCQNGGDGVEEVTKSVQKSRGRESRSL